MLKVLSRDLRVLIAHRYLDHFDRCVLRIALGTNHFKPSKELTRLAAERGYVELMEYFWDIYNTKASEVVNYALRGNQVQIAALFPIALIKRAFARVRLTDEIICKFKRLLQGGYSFCHERAKLFESHDMPLLTKYGIRAVCERGVYGREYHYKLIQ